MKYVIGGIIFSALAQIFIKKAGEYESISRRWLLFIFFSLVSYGLSFGLYYLSLKRFPISVIAPAMTVGVVILVVCFGFFSGEAVSLRQGIGILLAVVGIFLILN